MQVLGCRVWGVGFRVYTVQGLGFTTEGRVGTLQEHLA